MRNSYECFVRIYGDGICFGPVNYILMDASLGCIHMIRTSVISMRSVHAMRPCVVFMRYVRRVVFMWYVRVLCLCDASVGSGYILTLRRPRYRIQRTMYRPQRLCYPTNQFHVQLRSTHFSTFVLM